MATEIDAARLLCLKSAWLKDNGKNYDKASAMAKVFASERLIFSNPPVNIKLLLLKIPNLLIFLKFLILIDRINFFTISQFFLLEKKISGAPVVSRSGKLIGIISETDLMKQIVDSKYYNMPMIKTTVSKYMTKNVDSILPNDIVIKFIGNPANCSLYPKSIL